MMYDGTSLSSSDSEMGSKENKNRRSTFKIELNMHFYSLKNQDDALFKNRSKSFLCTKYIKDRDQF